MYLVNFSAVGIFLVRKLEKPAKDFECAREGEA